MSFAPDSCTRSICPEGSELKSLCWWHLRNVFYRHLEKSFSKSLEETPRFGWHEYILRITEGLDKVKYQLGIPEWCIRMPRCQIWNLECHQAIQDSCIASFQQHLLLFHYYLQSTMRLQDQLPLFYLYLNQTEYFPVSNLYEWFYFHEGRISLLSTVFQYLGPNLY